LIIYTPILALFILIKVVFYAKISLLSRIVAELLLPIIVGRKRNLL